MLQGSLYLHVGQVVGVSARLWLALAQYILVLARHFRISTGGDSVVVSYFRLPLS